MSDHFIRGCKNVTDPVIILNWYRNLYSHESEETEQGIVSDALNKILPVYVSQLQEIKELNIKIERLKRDVSVARDAYTSIQDSHEHTRVEAIKEFAERLKSYLLFSEEGSSISIYLSDEIDSFLKESIGDKE